MLDTWEGIKQLKAALWALVSIHSLSIYVTSLTLLQRDGSDSVCFPCRETLALQTGVWISCRRRTSFQTSSRWLSTARCCQYEGKLIIFSFYQKIPRFDCLKVITLNWCSPRFYVPMHLKFCFFLARTQCSQWTAPQSCTEAGSLSFIRLYLISHVDLKHLSNNNMFTNLPLPSTGHVFMFWVWSQRPGRVVRCWSSTVGTQSDTVAGRCGLSLQKRSMHSWPLNFPQYRARSVWTLNPPARATTARASPNQVRRTDFV